MTVNLDSLADTIVKLSILKKELILVGALILISVVYYYSLCVPKQEEIGRLEVILDRLQKDLEKKQALASKLPAYKEEVARLDAELVRVRGLAQLPSTREIPGLLSDISRLGKETGLEFLLFRPKLEVSKNFYSEVPVDIEVLGSFHGVATFFDRISNLPRTVNVTNVNMAPSGDRTKGILLKTSCCAKTFRFLGVRQESETKKCKRK